MIPTIQSTDIQIIFKYGANEVALDPFELDVHLHQAFKLKTDEDDPAWIIDFRNRLRSAYNIPFTSQDAIALVDGINSAMKSLKKTPDDSPSSPEYTASIHSP